MTITMYALTFTAITVGTTKIHVRGVIKKYLARYASVRFTEIKSLSVGHLI